MIYKFLLFLANKPTPQLPERFLRLLDRYTRKANHRDAEDRPTGYAIAAWLRRRNDDWYEVFNHQGIRAAINLDYHLA